MDSIEQQITPFILEAKPASGLSSKAHRGPVVATTDAALTSGVPVVYPGC